MAWPVWAGHSPHNCFHDLQPFWVLGHAELKSGSPEALGSCSFERALRHAGVEPHLDRVFPTVVDQGNSPAMLLYPIDCYACLALSGAHPQDRDVVHSFAIPIMHHERLPVLRKTRG